MIFLLIHIIQKYIILSIIDIFYLEYMIFIVLSDSINKFHSNNKNDLLILIYNLKY